MTREEDEVEPVALRLGIDLDGVVADFHQGWVRRYCEDFDAAIRPDQIVGWDSLTELTHFDDDREFWRWARACDPGIFRELPVIDGAAETLRSLAAEHRIVVITAKVGWAVPDTLAWLAEHRLPVSDVHFTFEKHEVACDVYLDDSPHHLVSFLEEHPDATVCRMVRPWNDPVDGAVDVRTWEEFAAVVDDVATGGATGGGTGAGTGGAADLASDVATGAGTSGDGSADSGAAPDGGRTGRQSRVRQA